MQLPSLAEAFALAVLALPGLGLFFLIAAGPWRKRPLVADAGGALAFGGVFLVAHHRVIGGPAWPPAGDADRLAWCVAFASVLAVVESPFWRRPWIARAVRLPAIALLLLWFAGGTTKAGPATIAAWALLLLVDWSLTKELAVHHAGFVVAGLAACIVMACLLVSAASHPGAPLLGVLGALLLAAVPFTRVIPRTVAGRGMLAPVVIATGGVLWAATNSGIRPLPPLAALSLAFAPLALWVLRIPALRRRSRLLAPLLAGALLILALGGAQAAAHFL